MDDTFGLTRVERADVTVDHSDVLPTRTEIGEPLLEHGCLVAVRELARLGRQEVLGGVVEHDQNAGHLGVLGSRIELLAQHPHLFEVIADAPRGTVEGDDPGPIEIRVRVAVAEMLAEVLDGLAHDLVVARHIRPGDVAQFLVEDAAGQFEVLITTLVHQVTDDVDPVGALRSDFPQCAASTFDQRTVGLTSDELCIGHDRDPLRTLGGRAPVGDRRILPASFGRRFDRRGVCHLDVVEHDGRLVLQGRVGLIEADLVPSLRCRISGGDLEGDLLPLGRLLDARSVDGAHLLRAVVDLGVDHGLVLAIALDPRGQRQRLPRQFEATHGVLGPQVRGARGRVLTEIHGQCDAGVVLASRRVLGADGRTSAVGVVGRRTLLEGRDHLGVLAHGEGDLGGMALHRELQPPGALIDQGLGGQCLLLPGHDVDHAVGSLDLDVGRVDRCRIAFGVIAGEGELGGVALLGHLQRLGRRLDAHQFAEHSHSGGGLHIPAGGAHLRRARGDARHGAVGHLQHTVVAAAPGVDACFDRSSPGVVGLWSDRAMQPGEHRIGPLTRGELQVDPGQFTIAGVARDAQTVGHFPFLPVGRIVDDAGLLVTGVTPHHRGGTSSIEVHGVLRAQFDHEPAEFGQGHAAARVGAALDGHQIHGGAIGAETDGGTRMHGGDQGILGLLDGPAVLGHLVVTADRDLQVLGGGTDLDVGAVPHRERLQCLDGFGAAGHHHSLPRTDGRFTSQIHLCSCDLTVRPQCDGEALRPVQGASQREGAPVLVVDGHPIGHLLDIEPKQFMIIAAEGDGAIEDQVGDRPETVIVDHDRFRGVLGVGRCAGLPRIDSVTEWRPGVVDVEEVTVHGEVRVLGLDHG